MMYVMCAPIPHGAKVRARGLVTQRTRRNLSPAVGVLAKVSRCRGLFFAQTAKAKGRLPKTVRPRRRKKSEKKFAGRLTLPFGMV